MFASFFLDVLVLSIIAFKCSILRPVSGVIFIKFVNKD